ncbi:MAG: DUF1971 domain-containing protein [Tsuneonella sp.]
MSEQLPAGLIAYKSTPLFNEATIPAGLLRDHSTKDGVWGLIRVEAGQLRYVVTDDQRAACERVLSSSAEPGVVEPTILHHVEPLGPVRFYVEFYR